MAEREYPPELHVRIELGSVPTDADLGLRRAVEDAFEQAGVGMSIDYGADSTGMDIYAAADDIDLAERTLWAILTQHGVSSRSTITRECND
jgi:hypothetical protein